MREPELPDLSTLISDQKDDLIRLLFEQVRSLTEQGRILTAKTPRARRKSVRYLASCIIRNSLLTRSGTTTR